MSVDKYTRKFEKLSILSRIEEAPEHKVSRYIGGLERKLGKKVDVHAYGSFDHVVQKALKFEKYDKISSANGYFKPTFKNNFASKGETSKPIAKDDKGKAPMHFSSKDDQNKMSNRKCEMDDDEYEHEKEDFEDPIYDEEDKVVVEADEGQILVVRRALHSVSTPLVEEQRENIFQTRCTIKDRVCNLIIDSGSCTNVSLTTLVRKLNLDTTNHPTPYKRQCLNNHNEVKVMIIRGKDRGETGTIKRVIRSQNRVIVEGKNLVKKHIKQGQGHEGGIFTVEAPLHVSNVQVVDPIPMITLWGHALFFRKPCKVGIRYLEDGGKVRIARGIGASGSIIPRPEILKIRTTPRPTVPGPKDTPMNYVLEKTYDPKTGEGMPNL
uniref:Ribosomal protein L24 n=1 Tax=Chenopodium quinoa TaxID=63459 RepID=A0A803LSI2_CHEQI